MEKMNRIIQRSGKIWKVFTVLACIFMSFSAVIIIVNIITRKFFNAPIFGSTEMVSYASLAVASFAMIDCEWADGNITLTILLDHLRQKTHYFVNAIEHIIMGAFYIIVDILLVRDTLSKFATKLITTDLHMSKWIFSGITAVGFIVLTFVAFTKAALYILAAKNNETINFNEIGRVDARDF